MEVVITAPARDDLQNIYFYLLENFYSERLADKSIDDLLNLIELLEQNPEMGLDADKKFGQRFVRNRKLYLLISEKNLIWYVIMKNKINGQKQVNILRITDQRQDVARLIFTKPNK